MKKSSLVAIIFTSILGLVLGSFFETKAQKGDFPKLILQKAEVSGLRKAINENAIVKKSFAQIKANADKAIQSKIVVPIPKDPGGGYTHEKHKSNYRNMYEAGLAYQLTENKKYAAFVRDMLLKYAEMYPKIGLHPQKKNQAPGKLFWQNLNETVWLVYSIQAYDCVVETLSKKEKKTIEKNVFREMVKFISVDNQRTFDKVHNHGTWAVAGVGMTGYVLGDTSLVNKSIFGTQKNGTSGFLKQIDELFSPDGYYAEGPYYQRYALMPFILFAQAIENNQPELKVFEFKDKVLGKAVDCVLQLTNEAGYFFPLNDGLSHKNYHTAELIFATNIAYKQYKNKNLLPIIRKHQKVMLSGAGLEAAIEAEKLSKADFSYKPQLIRDGVNGNDGGIGLLRVPFKHGQLTGLMKFTTQGMGHGHFDRLSVLLYDGAQDVLSDYGAARFLNVPAKHGGRYLPENQSWARQTIAHNTVTVDEASQFKGKWKAAQKSAPNLDFYTDEKNIQIISANDTNAYPGVAMRRILVMVNPNEAPFLIDLFKLESKVTHQYDYAFHYTGHLMESSFNLTTNTTKLEPLGKKNGYQHLWLEAKGSTQAKQGTFTWWHNKQFYSITTTANDSTQFLLTRVGANDPEFNLRHQPSYIIREPAKANHLFASVIEPHGAFDPTLETVQSPSSQVEKVEIEHSDETLAVVKISFKNGKTYRCGIAYNSTKEAKHEVKLNEEILSWKGNFILQTK